MSGAGGDIGLTAIGLAVCLPPIVLPWFIAPDARAEDVLGLRYAFPTTWNVGAVILGTKQMPIPITMYLLTHAYFLTYHSAIFVVRRRLGRSLPILVLLCCFFAFAETATMATPFLDGLFWYESKTKMLTVGTAMYGSLFLVSAPMLMRVEATWTYGRVWMSVLAGNMIQFWIFETWARALL